MGDVSRPATAPVRRVKLLAPRLHHDFVSRPRLATRLDSQRDATLMLLVAPPGFGKTTLLSEWATSRQEPVAWLTLDERDNSLAAFTRALIASLALALDRPELGSEVLAILRHSSDPRPHVVADVLADAVFALGHDLTLALDDYQTIDDPDVHAILTTLLDQPPPGLRVAIASRIEPPLALARLRARGRLLDVRNADLHFTHDETVAFLTRAVGDGLSPATVALLEDRTEGWVAGLRLASLALRDAADDSLAFLSARGGGRGIIDFLMEEVLASQRSALRAFLFTMAPVERFSAALCDALLDAPGAGRALLDEALAANVYLTSLDADGEWYRFHGLFRELLLDRIDRQFDADTIATLHARASSWFEGAGMVDEAIAHAHASGDDDLAAATIERHAAAALDAGEWMALDDWLRLVPASILQRRPALLLAMAWLARMHGRYASIPPLLERARMLLGADERIDAHQLALHGELDVLEADVMLQTGHGGAVSALAMRALERLPSERSSARGTAEALLAFGLQHEGHGEEALRRLELLLHAQGSRVDALTLRLLHAISRIHLYAGRLDECVRTCDYLATLARDTRTPQMAVWADHFRGIVSWERNALGDATRFFAAVRAQQRHAHTWAYVDATLGLALCQDGLGDPDAADSTIGELARFLLEIRNAEFVPRMHSCQARLALDRGDPERALRLLPALDGQRETLTGMECCVVTRVRVALALDSHDTPTTRDLLRQLCQRYDASHNLRRRVEVRALDALLAQRDGDRVRAHARLRESLVLGAPAGFIRTWLGLGPALIALIEDLTDDDPAIAATRSRLLDAAVAQVCRGGTACGTHADEHEALSQRELEVLAGLARRLSNKEIAQELRISPETVKRHAATIYAKLDVDNRRQAVQAGIERGVIDVH